MHSLLFLRGGATHQPCTYGVQQRWYVLPRGDDEECVSLPSALEASPGHKERWTDPSSNRPVKYLSPASQMKCTVKCNEKLRKVRLSPLPPALPLTCLPPLSLPPSRTPMHPKYLSPYCLISLHRCGELWCRSVTHMMYNWARVKMTNSCNWSQPSRSMVKSNWNQYSRRLMKLERKLAMKYVRRGREM